MGGKRRDRCWYLMRGAGNLIECRRQITKLAAVCQCHAKGECYSFLTSLEKRRELLTKARLSNPPFWFHVNEAVALPAVTFAQLCELLRLLCHYVGASSSALVPIIRPKLHFQK
jgi:hypothetical protein